MSMRSRVISFGSAALLVVAGIAVVATFTSTFGQVLALVLMGSGFVLATGLVFYEVGLSEDREREREAALKRPESRPPGPRRPRLRLDRRRGQRRRLD